MPESESDSTDTSVSSALFAGDALWVSSWKESAGEATLKRRMHDIDEPDLILYASWFCPFAQRAWIAAEECGVKYRWVEINPYRVDLKQPGGYSVQALHLDEKKALYPEFLQASPRGLLPEIEHYEKLTLEANEHKETKETTKVCRVKEH